MHSFAHVYTVYIQKRENKFCESWLTPGKTQRKLSGVPFRVNHCLDKLFSPTVVLQNSFHLRSLHLSFKTFLHGLNCRGKEGGKVGTDRGEEEQNEREWELKK